MDGLQVVLEPRRREILRLIWDEEASAGTIAAHFDVSFGAVSQHLGVLRDAGFVALRKDGTRRFYRADHRGLGELTRVLEAMWSTRLDDLVSTVESDVRTRQRRTTRRRGA